MEICKKKKIINFILTLFFIFFFTSSIYGAQTFKQLENKKVSFFDFFLLKFENTLSKRAQILRRQIFATRVQYSNIGIQVEFDSKNESYTKFQPFHRAKVKVKKEVVPLGFKITNKNKNNDNYLSFNSWNNLIKNKKTIVIDVRKPFEYHIGTFKNAINPKIKNFRDFPRFLKKVAKNKPVAMFCTGGIRCEKASAYLSKKGFKNTFQLKGGVLNYLKNIKKKESLWNGECFVFDNRISVKHKLRQGTYSMCSGCRTPVSTKDKKSQKYEEGVSCPNCHDKLTNSQKMRFRMRQKQINLAKKLGTKHIFQKEFY